jgi:hypothetical protein
LRLSFSGLIIESCSSDRQALFIHRKAVPSDVSSDDVEVEPLPPWGYCGLQDLMHLRIRPTDG